jgi:hypothetical protein
VLWDRLVVLVPDGADSFLHILETHLKDAADFDANNAEKEKSPAPAKDFEFAAVSTYLDDDIIINIIIIIIIMTILRPTSRTRWILTPITLRRRSHPPPPRTLSSQP